MHEGPTVNIDHILGILRRRASVIVLCAILVATAAFLYSKQQRKIYTATASLLFSHAQLGQQVAGLPATGDVNGQQAGQDTNVELVQLGDMAAKTATTLGHGLTSRQIAQALSVSAVGDTNVVRVSAVSVSPRLAAAIANTYSNQFVSEQQKTNQQYYAQALAVVSKQFTALSQAQRVSSAGIALQDRAQSLATLAELRSGTVQVVQSATAPTTPSSPKTLQTTLFALVLGLLVGLGTAFLLERSDRIIREPSDLADIYGVPLLGAIPESVELSDSIRRNGASGASLPPAEEETFHLLRAHLRYFNVDREIRTVLIASSSPGDGKTTIACHLAGAAARLGAKTLLVEADVRRPTISARLQLASGPGLAEVLIGFAPMSEAVRTVALTSSGGSGRIGQTLDVLAAGAAPPNAAALIESRAMEALLAEARATYDLVILDTPPLTAVSDAFPLLRKVDGVIVVGRVGRDRRDVAHRTRDTLNSVGASLLGVIANGVKASGRGPYYGYYYSHGDSSLGAAPLTGRQEGLGAADVA